MPKLKLTKTVVDAAQKEAAPYELRDTAIPGLLLKVTPTGRKIFMLAYVANNGQRRKPAIGQFGEITVDRALGDRRRDRFLASASGRVVDDDIGLSGHVCLELAQKARHFSRSRSNRRHIVIHGIHKNQGFRNEIQRTPDLTMPETPTDPFDGPGDANAGLAITLRRVGPTRGCLSDVLNPHREMKPVQHMMSWTRTGGFTERSRAVGTITQDGDWCCLRRSQSMKHTTQLSSLRSRLRPHAGEYDLLPLIVADLGEEDLERAPLVLTSRPHVAAVNGECNRFRRHHRLGARR